jgi:hypothetical protein
MTGVFARCGGAPSTHGTRSVGYRTENCAAEAEIHMQFAVSVQRTSYDRKEISVMLKGLRAFILFVWAATSISGCASPSGNSPASADVPSSQTTPQTSSTTPQTSGPVMFEQETGCQGGLIPLYCGGAKHCTYPGSNCCGGGFCGPGQRCEFINGRQECRY